MHSIVYIPARRPNNPESGHVGHSQAEKTRSRQRILEAAASQLKENGLDGVSIADLMKSAKLTHGGFYGHFESREDLVAQAVDKALRDGEAESIRVGSINGRRTLKSFLKSYLNKTHRDNPSTGCAIAALAADVARTDDRRTREIMSNHLVRTFENIDKFAGDGNADDFAITVMCAAVGAITLSRVMTDAEESDRILSAVRKTLLECAETRSS
ncbi:TetR/AcrR family transcriptional regulator [Bradyrhizobium sp. GCM10027634]|uniref:TetR/AcrR family transcriptional regulator n=1 Tax=unclassified Bradyrhizobium TaxID=2631580 RepID=UPI00263BAD35|nr:TetR/AcrR family transcriptional regulator [Bradyrhizobium sp. WYCCWR 12677]MDN5005496.1 TetR/AcrR family transcriptional regulator [Bradyrhizobium sp. WYCCWR 12677]